MEKGYRYFIVNNVGHFSFFRTAGANKEKPVLITGPWLYTFNAWAWNLLARDGAAYCVSPLENSRQNLERCFQKGHGQDKRGGVFVTVFSRPALYHIRANLGRAYEFRDFSDNKDEAFRIASEPEGSIVHPWQPFSIVDKIPFLREAGFNRFILDFSSGALKKIDYREVMEAANNAITIPGASRFNWKNGFFQPR
jgi:putative protease